MGELRSGNGPGPAGLVLSPRLYEEAYTRGLSLSAFLEQVDPTEKYPDGDAMKQLDAFERQLFLAGIRPFSNPRRGLWADKVEKFWTSDREGAEALFPEFVARVWRSIGLPETRVPGFPGLEKRFYMSSSPISDVLHPDYVSTVVRQKQIAPAIPLSEIVAITTPIDSGVYKAFYLTDDQDERRMRRVAEGAEVPTAKLTGGDHSINVKKYGRRLLGTYEVFRRMRIDRFALHVALLATQAEVDKVKTGIDVLINGDGNTSTAATNYNISTLDADWSSGDNPTLKGYLAWRMKWTSPYYCNVVLAREADILNLLMCNAGTANVLFGQVAGMFGIGGVTPIGAQLGPARVGWEDQCTADKWLGIDNRFALEMVTEIGATLTETNKIISTQWNEIVMTESVGFCIFDSQSNRTLTLNA